MSAHLPCRHCYAKSVTLRLVPKDGRYHWCCTMCGRVSEVES